MKKRGNLSFMYTDIICTNHVLTDNYVCPALTPPVSTTAEVDNVFNDILDETITSAAAATSQTCPDTSVNTNYHTDSVPPVIKTQETNEATSYLSKYYPIPEADVLQEIRNVRHVIDNKDMSEKTEVQRYDWIEEQFKQRFGDDFMIARNLSLPSSMFYMIGIEFSDTLGRFIENPEQVNRERLFGDASAGSVQDKIREKYPEELTNRDLMLMTNEMRNSGVLDTASLRSIGEAGTVRLVDTLAMIRSYIRFNEGYDAKNDKIDRLSLAERDKQWLSMMNRPIHIGDLLLMHNVWKDSGRVNIGEDVAPLFVKYMGGVLDENGFFILPGGGPGSWDVLLNALMAEFEEYDNIIRDRMKEIDGLSYTGPELVVVPDVNDGEENSVVGEAGEGGDGDIEVNADSETAGAEENLDSEESGEQEQAA